jgi:hypothetical protein
MKMTALLCQVQRNSTKGHFKELWPKQIITDSTNQKGSILQDSRYSERNKNPFTLEGNPRNDKFPFVLPTV